MKRTLLLYLLLLYPFIDSAAFEVMITPLIINDPGAVPLSGRRYSARIAQSNFYLIPPSLKSSMVSNLLDASKFCENEAVDNIIYGFIKTERGRAFIELRLYNHESRSIVRTFYAGDNLDQINRLIDDAAFKIHSYFVDELGLYEDKDKREEPDLLSLTLGAGYWAPLMKEWGDAEESLFSVKAGLLLNPDYDLIDHYNMALTFHFGISFSYEMGINDPAYEIFYLHRIKALIPVELRLNLITKHDISLHLSPLYQLDILDKRKKYDDSEIDLSSGFGFSTGIAYHYNFSKYFSAGISNNLDFIFYQSPQVTYRPEFSFLLHSALFKKGKNK